MLTNNNSYPLFIKSFYGFKIVQKERGYYYDKTLKHRIWLYTVNLRRNSFFTLKELIPLKSFVNRSSVCVSENIETSFRTNESDITDYQRGLLTKSRYRANYDLNFYKRLIQVKNQLKSNVLGYAPFVYIYFDHNKYEPIAFTNRGSINRLKKKMVNKMYLYRFMLRRSPFKFWNIFPFFVKAMNYLLNKLTTLTLSDFLILINMLLKKQQVMNYLKKVRPWNTILYNWNAIFSKIMSLKSIMILKITKKIKSDFWINLVKFKDFFKPIRIWETNWTYCTSGFVFTIKAANSKRAQKARSFLFLKSLYKKKKKKFMKKPRRKKIFNN